jgi:hypothetical protein
MALRFEKNSDQIKSGMDQVLVNAMVRLSLLCMLVVGSSLIV